MRSSKEIYLVTSSVQSHAMLILFHMKSGVVIIGKIMARIMFMYKTVSPRTLAYSNMGSAFPYLGEGTHTLGAGASLTTLAFV